MSAAEYTCTIGAALLGARWVNPEFDPAQEAHYYVCVFEIPTPSWLAYDRAHFGNETHKLPDDAIRVHQERAYTSPIWYTP